MEERAEPAAGGEDLHPREWLRLSGLVEAALELDRPLRGAWLEALRARSPAVVERVRAILAGLEGGAAPASPAAADPRRIGAYRLVELIGRGGMGEVYLAERSDREFEHQVAIKLIAGALDKPLAQQRFFAERQILARFDHPGIARLYEGGTTADGRPYFVLEYIRGEAIDLYCDRHQLDLEARLELFLQVCSAVQYAHSHLVIHRDLKPGNVLVDGEGRAKLLDFGIAKLLEPSSMPFEMVATQTSQRAMTPAYASPEQLAGQPATTATDVFSLGVLLYRLLCGELPFAPGEAPTPELLAARQQAPLAPSRRLRQAVAAGDGTAPHFGGQESRTARRIAGGLDAIVSKALRFEPEARYVSAAALAGDVENFLKGETVAAARDSVIYRLRAGLRRYRWPLLAAAALLALLLGWAGSLQRQVAATGAERDRARATRDFLVDLLQQADEQGRVRRQVSLEELLDAGFEQLGDPRRTLPRESRVDLLEAIGDSYSSFADRAGAVQAFAKALAATRPEERELRRRLLMKKAESEIQSGYPREAEISLGLLLAELDPADVAGRAQAASRLAMIAERDLDTRKALAGFREAARLLGAEGLGQNDEVAFDLLRNWVYSLDRNQHAAEGRILARRSYLHFLARKGPEAPETFFFVAHLGNLEQALGHGEASVSAYREALRILEKTSHRHDPRLALNYNGLACALALTGPVDAALRESSRGLERLAELDLIDPLDQGTRSLEAGFLLDRCAILHHYGRGAELAATAQRLLVANDRLPGPADRAEKLLTRGMALAYLGRRAEAQPLIERGMAEGWSWSSLLDYLQDLDLPPPVLPTAALDFSPPPEVDALLPPAPEGPMPWQANEGS